VLISKFYMILTGSLLMILLARWLSPVDYGYFQLVLSVVAILPILTDFGLSHSLPRYVAEYTYRDPTRVRTIVFSGLILKFVLLTAVCLVIFLFRDTLADFFRIERRGSALEIGILILLVLNLYNFLFKIFEGFQRFKILPIMTLIKNSSDLVISLGLVYLGYGIFGALFGKFSATLFAVIFALVFLYRRIFRDLPGRVAGWSEFGKKIIGYGSALIVVDGATRIFANVDKIVINNFLTAGMVGLYAVPFRMVELAQAIGLSVASAISPSLSQTLHRENPETGQFVAGLRWLLAFYVLIAVYFVNMADWIILTFFGGDYAGSVPVLRVLGCALPLMGISPLISLSLNYLGEAKKRAVIASITAMISVAGNVILVPRLGITGSAIILAIAYLFYVIMQMAICLRRVGVSYREVYRFSSRILLTGLIAFGLLHAFLVVWESPYAPVLAVPILGVLYVALLFFVKVISPDELSHIYLLVRQGRTEDTQ
jgi:O-antigen/teichoic acid export membrane protein